MNHSKLLQPSGWVKWVNCPPSAAREAQHPETPSGEAAVDGTHTHTLNDTVIRETQLGTPFDAAPYVGRYLEDHEGKFFVDKDRAVRSQIFLTYAFERAAAIGASIQSEVKVQPGSVVPMTESSFLGDLYEGTCDLLLDGPKVLEGVDYKDGRVGVDPLDNGQIISYLIERFFQRIKERNAPEEVVLTIIQPKVSSKPVSAHYTFQEFYDVASKIVVYAQNAAMASPFDVATPGDHCKWCRAKLTCQEYADMGTKAIQAVLPQQLQIDVSSWTDEKLEHLLDVADLIREVLKDGEEEAVKRVKTGSVFVNHKAIHAPTRKSWSKSGEEVGHLLSKGRGKILKSQLFKQAVNTPAQVLAHDLSPAQVKRVEEMIRAKEPTLKIVRRTEKGEEVRFDVENVMEQIDMTQTPVPQGGDTLSFI